MPRLIKSFHFLNLVNCEYAECMIYRSSDIRVLDEDIECISAELNEWMNKEFRSYGYPMLPGHIYSLKQVHFHLAIDRQTDGLFMHWALYEKEGKYLN